MTRTTNDGYRLTSETDPAEHAATRPAEQPPTLPFGLDLADVIMFAGSIQFAILMAVVAMINPT